MSYKSIFLCILSASLLILSFPKPELEFLAWFALVPWFLALQKKRPRDVFLLSYLVGLVSFSGIVWWVTYVSSLGFSVLVLCLALYFALFGLAFSLFTFHFSLFTLFIIPCLWVALEYIRSHLFTGFGWALLGYSQFRNLPIIQISDISGAYGVSFLIVLVNVGIWQTIMRVQSTEYRVQKKSLAPVLCSLFSVLFVLGYGYFKLNQPAEGKDVKVAVVQGNIPQWMKWDPGYREHILERYTHLTETAALAHPEIIVWPETAVPGYLEDDTELLDEMTYLSQRVFPAYLLVGTPQVSKERSIYNSATLIHDGKIIQRYDKLHLVPFGEFMPWPGVFSRFSFASLIGDFIPGEDYTVFSLRHTGSEVKFSALICFEDVFAHLARNFVHRGARILINMTNDAWFRDSAQTYQHLQASVFRAVENRVNVARSANTGVSCFINPWGKILSRVADNSGQDVLVKGEKSQSLPIVSMRSLYTAFGDVFAWLCIAFAALALIRRR